MRSKARKNCSLYFCVHFAENFRGGRGKEIRCPLARRNSSYDPVLRRGSRSTAKRGERLNRIGLGRNSQANWFGFVGLAPLHRSRGETVQFMHYGYVGTARYRTLRARTFTPLDSTIREPRKNTVRPLSKVPTSLRNLSAPDDDNSRRRRRPRRRRRREDFITHRSYSFFATPLCARFRVQFFGKKYTSADSPARNMNARPVHESTQ